MRLFPFLLFITLCSHSFAQNDSLETRRVLWGPEFVIPNYTGTLFENAKDQSLPINRSVLLDYSQSFGTSFQIMANPFNSNVKRYLFPKLNVQWTRGSLDYRKMISSLGEPGRIRESTYASQFDIGSVHLSYLINVLRPLYKGNKFCILVGPSMGFNALIFTDVHEDQYKKDFSVEPALIDLEATEEYTSWERGDFVLGNFAADFMAMGQLKVKNQDMYYSIRYTRNFLQLHQATDFYSHPIAISVLFPFGREKKNVE